MYTNKTKVDTSFSMDDSIDHDKIKEIITEITNMNFNFNLDSLNKSFTFISNDSIDKFDYNFDIDINELIEDIDIDTAISKKASVIIKCQTDDKKNDNVITTIKVVSINKSSGEKK